MSSHSYRSNQPKTNPFLSSLSDRSHFPSLTQAFRSSAADDSDGYSDAQNTSILSIGERAALNDHLRHVAKYGLDRSTDGSFLETGNHNPIQNNQNNHHSNQSSEDSEWERLLQQDGDQSFDASLNGTASPASDVLLLAQEFYQGISILQEQGSDDIEVIADTSSDFFNTSRVLELFTPERNLQRKPRITSRQTATEDSLSSSGASEHNGLLELLQQPTSAADQSFFSLSAVDVSRISNSDDSFIKYQSQQHTNHPETSFVLDCSFAAATPNRSFISAASPPRRKPPLHPRASPPSESPNTSNTSIVYEQQTQETKQVQYKQRQSQLDRNMKENEYNGISPSAQTAANTAAQWMEVSRQSRSLCYDNSDRWSDVSSVQNVSSPSSVNTSHQTMMEWEDRRRYRTVVPHRVFLEDCTDSFYPEQRDSFSAPPAMKRRTRTRRDDSPNTW